MGRIPGDPPHANPALRHVNESRIRRRAASAALLLALCACGSLPNPTLVDDRRDDTADFPEAQEPPPPPVGPVPTAPELDWIKLTSGEWLRGTVERIRDGDLDFDSEILDDLTISLGDIAEIRTAKPQAVVTGDNKNVRGRVTLNADALWIEGVRTIALEPDQLFAAVPLTDGRAVDWSGEVAVGATVRSGNTKQNDFSANAEVLRETARTEWRTTYNGVASRARGIETANNHRIRSINNVYLTRRLFVTTPTLDLYKDRFQNIDYRVIPGAGLGYRFIDTSDQTWELGAGPAYQYTRFETVEAGEDEDEGFLAAVLLSEYEWDITDDVEFGLDYQITVSLEDADDYNHNLVARMGVDLTGDLTFNVNFVWDRVNNPSTEADGTTPLKDDYRTTIGLGWTF